MMICIRCGLQKSGKGDTFVCDDCKLFSEIIRELYEEVDRKISDSAVIDPKTDKLLQLIADSVFLTNSNPQTVIFYKMCEYIVHKAYNEEHDISEEELNRRVKTTRGWRDTLKVFEELDLIEVTVDDYQRIIHLTEKTKKLAKQYFSDEPLSDQIITRHTHIYAGYILLFILYNTSFLEEDSAEVFIPYGKKPKTLWNALMFLWTAAFKGDSGFSSEDFEKFLSKRRIPAATRGEILRALQSMSGKTVQTLIKEIAARDHHVIFKFNDYVLIEMRRVRDSRDRVR
jgi:hypothetical protein